MDKRFFGLLVLLFLLFAEEATIRSEATRMCKSRSREHKGRRCYNRNCNLICMHEKFVYGRCSRFQRCMCYKPCDHSPTPPGIQDPPPTPSTPHSPDSPDSPVSLI
ncbi:hypothetical protein ABFS82_11G032600 [Erythranthe guttata]